MKIAIIAELIIIVLAFAVSFYYYPQLPDQVASHWNAAGEVNGYTSRLMGAFFVPVLAVGLLLLFLAIPHIDPKKRNIEKFRRYYDGFIVIMLFFLLMVHVQTLLWNTGTIISMMITLSIGIGILFFYAGILMKNAKMNWFIGIRNPWTLSSEKVWDKTHALGSKLFMLSGIIAMAGVIWPIYAIFFIIIPVISTAIYTTVYSYFEYQKEKKKS